MVQVLFQEEALLNIEVPLFYIKSGEEEICKYVETVSKPEIDRYVDEEINPLVTDAQASKEAAAASAAEAAASKEAAAGSAQEAETSAGNAAGSAQAAATSEKNAEGAKEASALSAESAATSATEAAGSAEAAETTLNSAVDTINTAKTEAVEEFNKNAETQTAAFNQNATEKQTLVDNSAQAAATSAGNAAQSESNAAESAAECQNILQRMGTVIKIKGRVDAQADLPTSGNLDGDAYLVGPEGADSYPEYFWYLDHWEFMGTTATSLVWGTIEGDISQQTDLQAALAGKAGADEFESHAENKNNPHGVTKVQIGLGNCDNTSDANKPVSTAVQNALNLKANLISPAFSGTPTVPTPAVSDNSTKPATTNWFNQKIQVVSSLPASPNGNVFYFVTG